MTQNNLGSALEELGKRQSGTDRLVEATSAYTLALEVFNAAQARRYVLLATNNLTRVEHLLRARGLAEP